MLVYPNVLLLNLLDRHKVHGRSAGCVHDCLGIIGVVLVCHYKRFYELRTDQLHGVTAALENPRPVIGSSARFHHDRAGRKIGYISGQLSPSHALPYNGFAGMIGAVKLKGVFGNINAQYANSSHVDLPSQVEVLQLEG